MGRADEGEGSRGVDQGVGIKGSEILIVALDATGIEIIVRSLRRQSTKELFWYWRVR